MISAERLVWWSDQLLPLMPDKLLNELEENPARFQQVLASTNEFWLICADDLPVGLFGVQEKSLVANSVYIWFIPFKTYRLCHARAGRKLFEEWATGFRKVTAWCLDERAGRFARFFGFVEVSPQHYERTA